MINTKLALGDISSPDIIRAGNELIYLRKVISQLTFQIFFIMSILLLTFKRDCTLLPLLDILMEERIHKSLEKALSDSERYQSAQKEVDKAINELEEAELSREQNKAVDRAVSATNANGAAYGAAAYRQGFYDGIELISEITRISLTNNQDLIVEK